MTKKRCGAKSKKDGTPCKSWPIKGRVRCGRHGGLTPRGKDAGSFIHGMRSKYMKHLGDYESTHADPEALMDLTHQLAGFELLIAKAAERAKERDTPGFRRKLKSLFADVQQAMNGGDALNIMEALEPFAELIENGADADKADEYLAKGMERMAFRAEQAWKIRLLSAGTITPQAMRQALEAMGRIALEEAGADVGRKILERFDREIVEGRAAINLP